VPLGHLKKLDSKVALFFGFIALAVLTFLAVTLLLGKIKSKSEVSKPKSGKRPRCLIAENRYF
jgi:hypothetical protein